MYHPLAIETICWNTCSLEMTYWCCVTMAERITCESFLRIRVHDCKGNLNKFRVKALDRFYCRNGLDHTIVPHYHRSLASFSAAYGQLSEWWYWYCHICYCIASSVYLYNVCNTKKNKKKQVTYFVFNYIL